VDGFVALFRQQRAIALPERSFIVEIVCAE